MVLYEEGDTDYLMNKYEKNPKYYEKNKLEHKVVCVNIDRKWKWESGMATWLRVYEGDMATSSIVACNTIGLNRNLL